MKKVKIGIAVIMLLVLELMFLQACKKEENENPTCTIISPLEGQERMVGETITISINAADSDGSIKDVRVLINNKQKASLSNTPYKFEWNTTDENPGNHSIKVTCTDDLGAIGEDEITVNLKEEDSTFEDYTDPRDGKTYVTVTIGEQTWFTQNLDFDDNSNKQNSPNILGGYYSWSSAKNVCPDGWHLPTDEEWKELEVKMLMLQSEADQIGWRGTVQGMWIKSKEGWKYEGNGTDRYGFNAIPAGYKNDDGDLFLFETDAVFWTATNHDSNETAWYRQLKHNSAGIYRSSTSTTARFSVRCVKD